MRERGKRLVRSAVIVGSVVTAAVGFGVVGTAQAYSGPHFSMSSKDGNPGGRVDFWPYGDVVQVCDTQADGTSVHVVIDDIDTFKGYELTAAGDGNCVTHKASQGGAYDLPERGASQGCLHFDIRLWRGDVTVWNSVNDAYWWNDNSGAHDC
jgi:hypothetical protein